MARSSAAETSKELEKELDEAIANKRDIFGYARYGNGDKWKRLDNLTGGIQPKTFELLVSRPKRGKSMLVSDWIPLVAEQALMEDEGRVVRVVSLEMSRKAYQRRMAAIMAGIKDPMNIRRGKLGEEDEQNYRDALKYLAALPIEYLTNERDLTEEETFKQGNSTVTFKDMERFIKGGGNTYWWVLDHIGLLNDLAPDGTVTSSVYILANKLANLAHSEATGLVLTHLTRNATGGEPSLEGIASSDQLGRNGDKIFLLWRPYMDATFLSDEDRETIREAEPAFLKFYSRDEGSGSVALVWDQALASFSEFDAPEGVRIPLPQNKRSK